MSTSGGKNIHTRGGSGGGGKGAGPPTIDIYPPPNAPVPTPTPKTSSVSNAGDTSDAVKIDGHQVLVEGSNMTLDPPGNQPAAPPGQGDAMHHRVNGKQKATGSSSNSRARGKGLVRADDSATMHQASAAGQASSTEGTLPAGGGSVQASPAKDGKKGKEGGKKKRKGGPLTASDGSEEAAKSEAAAQPRKAGDPVTVATGFVVDAVADLELPGLIRVSLTRNYSSAWSKLRTPLGRGGWKHSLDQWVEVGEAVYRYQSEDGRLIYFAKVPRGQSTFHRRERLTLTPDRYGGFSIEDARSRLTRYFGPSVSGGPARLKRVSDPYGNRVELSYEGEKLLRVDDTAGRSLVLRHDDKERVLRAEIWSAGATPTLCQWVDYTYSAEGDLETATDALGGVLRYAYDGFHRLVQRTLQTGISFYYTYDEDSGRCVKTVGDGGLYKTELHFNLDKKTTTTSGNREPRKYTWNAEGLVTREETFDKSLVRVREYDRDHYLLAEANGAGERNSARYDARGNLVEIRDPANNATKWQIHVDRPIRKRDPDGHVTRYHYDGAGALIGLELPTGLNYSLARDARGRLTSIHGPDGLVLGLAYDDQHNVVAETDARGAVTHYQYDALGRPIARTDALGRRTLVELDRLGRRTGIRYADGTTARAAYDARGRLVHYVDALGRETKMEYAGLHALARFVEPTGQVWTFDYDELERLERIVNPRKEEYRFHYTDAGQVEEEVQFHGRRLKYLYDRAERLRRIDYSDRTYRELTYDTLGNLLADESPHGDARFERDARGRILSAILKDPSATVVTRFERDELGRVIRETQDGAELLYEYDARGRRSKRVLPNGATTRYHYDPTGELVALEHDGHKVAIQRDVLGREVRRHVHDGRVDVFKAYDAMDRLIDQAVVAPAVEGDGAARTLSRRRLSYDALGRVEGIDDQRWGTTHYRYDSLGQLLQATRGSLDEVFEYDVTGSLHNKLSSLAGVDRTLPWRVEKGNILTSTPDAIFENDEQGRRTKRVPKNERGERLEDQATEYWWDCRDRLREVREADGRRAVYTYDAFGRRARKELWPKERADLGAMMRLALELGRDALPKPTRLTFWWDGDAIAGEARSDGHTRVHVHEPGTLVPMLQAEGGEVFTVVNDHLGMPKELVDSDGRVAWAASHSAWGTIVNVFRDPQSRTPVESPFRLVGQYFDPETSLSSTRFRHFDAATGRWLEPDPLGNAGGYNLLAFNGSPTTTTDQLGLCPSVADDPVLHRLWEDSMKEAARGNNAYSRLLRMLEDGETPTNQELERAFGAVNRRFATKARDAGYDVSDLHHANFPKKNYPDQVTDPRNLLPTRSRDEHEALHRETSSTTSIWNGPVAKSHERQIDSSFYPLAPRK